MSWERSEVASTGSHNTAIGLPGGVEELLWNSQPGTGVEHRMSHLLLIGRAAFALVSDARNG